jgi:hypothetical protein
MNDARRAELEERCQQFLVANEPTPAQLLEFVQQVEREVWLAAEKLIRNHKPGLTVDIATGHLVEDEDGPWGLNSNFADLCRQQREGR